LILKKKENILLIRRILKKQKIQYQLNFGFRPRRLKAFINLT
jgi:hypothetical protein